MISPFGTMYLRPGNLWKDLQVRTMQTEWSGCHTTDTYADTGEHVTGILAAADSNLSDRMRHRWDQDQHSLTHTLIVRGRAELKKGDMLVLDERAFIVLIVDDVGALGASGIVYLEERNDIR